MKIKNRKHHKKCYSEKTLREVSNGKITKPVIVEVPKRFYKVLPNGYLFNKKAFLSEYNVNILEVIYHNNNIKVEIMSVNDICIFKYSTRIMKLDDITTTDTFKTYKEHKQNFLEAIARSIKIPSYLFKDLKG